MKDKPKLAAVIFDMDGLMLETEKPLIPLWIEAGKKFGRDIKEQTVISTIGSNSADTKKIFLEDLGDDLPYDELFATFLSMAKKKFERGIKQKPGLGELLLFLEAKKIPAAVGTSSSRKEADWKLEKAGLKGRFGVIVCGDEVARGKPAPDIFQKAASLLEAPPAQCVGIEDSAAGLRALASAGILSVFIKDIVEPPPEVLASIWKRCSDLGEVIGLLEGY